MIFLLILQIGEADVRFLSEMFPNFHEHYRPTLGLSMEKVLNLLLTRGDSEPAQGSKSILSDLTRQIDFDRDIVIEVN